MVRVVVTANRDGSLKPPITVQRWLFAYRYAQPCLSLRGAQWIRSYLSQDGQRSVCEYDAPYADAVREAAREAGVQFDRIWRADICTDLDASKITSIANPVLAEINATTVSSSEEWATLKRSVREQATEQGINQLWTLTSPDGKEEVWIFDADNTDTLRQIHQDLGAALQQVWQAQLLAPDLER